MKWAEMYNSKGTLIKKKNVKPIVDILMTIALLLLMSYELIGSTAHEIVGIVMFVLFITYSIFIGQNHCSKADKLR